ncbi:HAD-like domain-containing protein [Sphaerosporella brunnea]|uniref:HAD-like domain-containing protein n=1 Tax=Sphaerosporella brunnea TaxID=1250544 RepID=A0A5J5EYV2_9PEZI|nr:HAD-like domain-containing protein [Sphaerosporella brunnea]
MSPLARLRFLPLLPKLPQAPAPKLQGIIFDLDGTLTTPQPWMFSKIRALLKIPASQEILEFVTAPSWSERERAEMMRVVREVEWEAMLEMRLAPGVAKLVGWLGERGVRRAVLTRNYMEPVAHCEKLLGIRFEGVVTRAFRPWKPAPDGVLRIAGMWGLANAEGLMMVGDSEEDVVAGFQAGAATVLVRRRGNCGIRERREVGKVVDRLDELIPMLEEGFREDFRPPEDNVR